LRAIQHQYIERSTGRVRVEQLYGDGILKYLYSEKREEPGLVYQLLGSPWISALLGWATYDLTFGPNISRIKRFLDQCGVDLSECVEGAESFTTTRNIFERQIRYWQCRPMEDSASAIVSPADSRVLIGSLKPDSSLFLKGKFFQCPELFGSRQERWSNAFHDGDFVICRLTPEKYHYNHTPVAGVVYDFYETDGHYHSCNPTAVIALATPYSKNKRAVTMINTDVSGGSRIGLVAMFEIVALMIGDVVQCYSREAYEDPSPLGMGTFIEKGRPKSLFRPGSSTTVLLFEKDRVEFSKDLIRNLTRPDIETRYSEGLGRPLVETDIKVRSTIGYRKERNHAY
jgi:phosphatidylserine decarboxylase